MKILDIPQSGKRGLNVSQNGRYGQISRIYVVPSNPQTEAQMNVRDVFARLARGWDALTDPQRAAWVAAGATHMTKTRCGTNGPMTGLQFFLQINANLVLLGQEQVDAPPAAPTIPALAPQGLVITNTAGAIALKLTCPADPGDSTVIEGSAPQRAGVGNCTNFRVLGVCPAPAQGAADVTSIYVTRYGQPAVGTKVFVRCHVMVDGVAGVRRTFSALVPQAS
jgi:hypothetical protein